MTRLLKSLAFALLALGALNATPGAARAASAGEIDAAVNGALKVLYAHNSEARELAKRAAGILVFPKIVKGGLIVGGAFGEGALRQGGKTIGYYSSIALSYGLQAGAQTYGYALFIMNQEALAFLDQSEGWEIGTGPSVVVMDEGLAAKMSSTTLSQDVYAIIFNQSGLMAGLGIEGSKISRITPE